MKRLISDIFQNASEKNIEFSEIQLGQFSNTEIIFIEGKKKFSQKNFRLEINLRIWKDGKVGSSFTTSSSDLAISTLVDNAIESMNAIDANSDQYHWKTHSPSLEKDYRDNNDGIKSLITIKDKLDLIKAINKVINDKSTDLEVTINYFDKNGIFYFGNSNGYLVKNRISDYIIEINNHYHYAKKKIQRSYHLCGKLEEKKQLISICKSLVSKKTQRLLDSKILILPPKKKMNVVLDGEITGRIIHELCHGLDGDFVATVSPWRKKINKIIFSKHITVEDIPNLDNISNLPHLKYDCEGFKSKKTTLIENGKLINFITDNHTANLLKCTNTHNSRISSFELPSFPNSTNLIVSSGDYKFLELISEAGTGLYCQGASEINIDWDEKEIRIIPERSTMISQGEVIKEAHVNANINYSINEFMNALKAIGKKPMATTILCTKGGGILCGVISPPILFERLTVQN